MFFTNVKLYVTGLKTISKITSDGGNYQLRIEMESYKGEKKYAEYKLVCL